MYRVYSVLKPLKLMDETNSNSIILDHPYRTLTSQENCDRKPNSASLSCPETMSFLANQTSAKSLSSTQQCKDCVFSRVIYPRLLTRHYPIADQNKRVSFPPLSLCYQGRSTFSLCRFTISLYTMTFTGNCWCLFKVDRFLSSG